MNTKLTNLLASFILLIGSLSCQKVEENEDPQYSNILGEPLGEFYTDLDFVGNAKRKEIYFTQCESFLGPCDWGTLWALNYETLETRLLFRNSTPHANIAVLRLNSSTDKLYLLSITDLDGNGGAFTPKKSEFFEIDLETNASRRVLEGISMANLQLTEEYLFFRTNWSDSLLVRTDYEQIIDTLVVEGSIQTISSLRPEIVVYREDADSFFLYDYEADTILADYNGYFRIFYDSPQGILAYDDENLINLSTGVSMYQPIDYNAFLSFNPACMKVVYREERYEEVDNIPYTYILVEDLIDGTMTEVERIFGEQFDRAFLMDDCGTVIYTTMGRLFKTTVN